LVYIIFLLLFPILTRHAPSFFLASLKNRRGKMNRRMKYTLNNTVLFKKQSIKARHHLLRSIHFSRISFWRGGGGHAMAVNEKRGSRKRESTRERDAKERVRVLKITEWIIIRVNRSDPNAHTHKKERERMARVFAKKTKILCGRGRGDRHSLMKAPP
jgi:hypothetical protein